VTDSPSESAGAAGTHPVFMPAPPGRRWRSRVFLSVVAFLVIGLASVLGFGLGRNPTLIASPLVGKPAPIFVLRTLNGREAVRMSQLRGHVVVVNFWASWCLACREEHPNLMAAWQRYGDSGVVFLGIVYQDTVANARAFMREMGGGWPNLVDPRGRTALDYGVYGIPETYFIGRDGVISYKRVGPSSYALLTRNIERLLAHG